MKRLILAPAVLTLATLLAGTPAMAADAPATAAAAPALSSATTDIGTLLDNPASKAILQKYMPEMIANPQIDMARSMTLKQVQGFAPDMLSDQKLAQIDAELAKLPAK